MVRDMKGVLLPKLGLATGARERAEELFEDAYKFMQQQQGSSPSVLGTDRQSAEDAWAACIVWLIKSIPGLLEQETEDGRAHSVPLSELLDACGISLVTFFKELPVVLNKLKPWLTEAAGVSVQNLDSELRLREWQETLVSLTHLANKYKDLFWHIQRSSSSSSSGGGGSGGAGKQPLLRAGWLAFLVIKAQLLPGFPDMVSCLELLVCVLDLLLASSPFSEAQLQELQEQSPAAIDASGRFNTLKALSLEAKVDFANTRELMPKIEERFRALIEEAAFSWLPQPLPAQLPHPQADQLDTCCHLYLEGLCSNQQQLSELVLSLDAAYQRGYSQQGEIDEREFLLTDFGGLASPRTLPDASILMPTTALGSHGAPGAAAAAGAPAAAPKSSAARAAGAAGGSRDAAAMAVDEQQQQESLPAAAAAAAAHQQLQQDRHSSHAQQQQQQAQKPPLGPGGALRKGGIMLQGLQSPLPMMALGPAGPTTPISQAMGSVAWLRGLVKTQALEPSPKLQRYMEAAGPDAGRVLVSRVNKAAQAVFLSDGRDPLAAGGLHGLQQGLAQERQAEGIKLYYHVLEAMLTAEEARAGLPAAGALLTRWPFHQCLLACSFEVVAASYRMGLLSFPAIPAKLGLKPFDLSKMIGPFVKAEPTLPRELKRHMFAVEEKILESLGWAPGSSFFTQLRAATGQQQQQPRAAAAGVKQEQHGDASMQDADASQQQQQDKEQQEEDEDASALLPTAEQQRDLQHEAAAAAALSAQQAGAAGTGSAAAADSRYGIKRGSESGSAAAAGAAAGDAMDTDASRAEAAGSPWRAAASTAKRQRGQDGRPLGSQGSQGGSSGANGAAAAAAAAGGLEELPLPKALGPPPGSEGYTRGAAVGGNASAQAVLHDYCKKVLKLAAFRLVAVSEGLDFAPMTREEVVAHVHELLSVALYQHTHLFYSRHLDTLLLACLYGFCKVNKLNQITFREIIAHYKRQAHAKQEVFRTVVLQQTDPHLVTQSTGDIIAFYNAVFVPAMKSMLLSVNSAADAAAGGTPTAAANGVAAAADAAAATAKPSPMQTAMQLSSAPAGLQQQQQQRSLGSSGTVVAGGSAYRALSLPEPSGGPSASCSSLGLTGLGSGSSLLGGLGGPISLPPVAPGSSGGGSFWPGGNEDPAAAAAAAAELAAAAAAAGAGGSGGPSRLSRLSRAAGGGGGAGAATAVEGVALSVSGGRMQHDKALGRSSLQQQYMQQQSSGGRAGGAAAAAAPAAARGAFGRSYMHGSEDDQDAGQQQDQGSRRQRSVGFSSRDDETPEPPSPSGGGTSGDGDYIRDGSTEGHPGSSSGGPGSYGDGDHPSGEEMGLETTQQQQQERLRGLHPSPAAGAVGASPSAGLATLLQALDTKSVSPAVRRA